MLADMEAGHGLCVIDPHGDLFADLLGRIPPHRRDDVVLLDPTDVTSRWVSTCSSASTELGTLPRRAGTRRHLRAADRRRIRRRGAAYLHRPDLLPADAHEPPAADVEAGVARHAPGLSTVSSRARTSGASGCRPRATDRITPHLGGRGPAQHRLHAGRSRRHRHLAGSCTSAASSKASSSTRACGTSSVSAARPSTCAASWTTAGSCSSTSPRAP